MNLVKSLQNSVRIQISAFAVIFLCINYFFLSPVGSILSIALILSYGLLSKPSIFIFELMNLRPLFNLFLYFVAILFLSPYIIYYLRLFNLFNTCEFWFLKISCGNFHILYFGDIAPTLNTSVAAQVYSLSYTFNTLLCCLMMPIFIHSIRKIKQNKELNDRIVEILKYCYASWVFFVLLVGSLMRTFYASNSDFYSDNIWDVMTFRAFFVGPFSYFCLSISTLGLLLRFGSSNYDSAENWRDN